MLSHVMSLAAPTGYLIGDGTGEMPKDSRYFVLESCEYQRHFLAYKPEYAIITNIELDHVDYYKDMEDYCDAFEAFANQIQKGVVLFGDDAAVRSLHVKTEHLYYGLKDHNDVQAVHVKQHEDGMQFDVLYRKKLFAHFDLPFVGKPLLWNSLGVIAIGIMFFQQFVGINTVIYYSPKIFLMAGFDGAVSAIGASVGVGVVNLLFTLLSVYFVDRLGRRKLYFLGLSGIVISLLLLATSFIFAVRLGILGNGFPSSLFSYMWDSSLLVSDR